VIFKPSTRLFGLPRRRRLGEDGVSAVEFALIAPVLFIALLSMVDVGFAIYERMTIDYVLRAGAQAAMEDPAEGEVLAVLNDTGAKNFVAGAVPSFTVEHPICECPENADVLCSATCDGGAATSIFYRLEGTKTYEGIFMSIPLGPSMRVQVR
jgi:pilus assembly protein CpaE